MKFEWVPSKEMNWEALERMKQHFSKPTDPPYEAWFMSGINYHSHFLYYKPNDLDLEYYFYDTCGGIRSFGRLNEWVIWYQYFLPYVLTDFANGKSNYQVSFMSYFINLYSRGTLNQDINIPVDKQKELANIDYPGGIIEEYPGFRDDILSTLAQLVMAPQFWLEDDVKPEHLENPEDSCDTYYAELGFYQESFNLSAWQELFRVSMFFCLMYLNAQELKTWVASIAKIQGTAWHFEVSEWINGLERLLYYLDNPKEIPDDVFGRGDLREKITLDKYFHLGRISWFSVFQIFARIYSSRNLYDFIPENNLKLFWKEIEKHPYIRLNK